MGRGKGDGSGKTSAELKMKNLICCNLIERSAAGRAALQAELKGAAPRNPNKAEIFFRSPAPK